ncbi:MAG: PKD domain-containing protein [Lishizhenia sp.]
MKNIFKQVVLLFSLVVGVNVNAQCVVEIETDTVWVDCGTIVTLNAIGLSDNPALSTDFNGNQIGAGWQSSSTPLFTNPCGPTLDGTASAWFGNVPFPRTLTTNGFDLSCGGQVCFDLDFGNDDFGSNNCEDPDQTDEGVYFQYSINGGTTWIDLFYFEPTNGYANSYYQWDSYCFTLPVAASTANTMFQWEQPNASSTINDHWGIDNISIIPTNCGYWYDWSNLTGSVDPQSQTFVPDSSETFIVNFTDGVNGCSDTLNLIVDPCDCQITTMNALVNPCTAAGTFAVQGGVAFNDNPGTGNLLVEATNNSGTYTYTFSPPFTNGSFNIYYIANIPADGSPLEIKAHFTDDVPCEYIIDTLMSPGTPIVDSIYGGAIYCQGDVVNDILVDVQGTGPFTLDYLFDGLPQTITSPNNVISLGSAVGLYELTNITAGGCSAQVSLQDSIVINPLPITNAGADFLVCEGTTITLNGNGADTYVWDNGAVDGVSFIQAPGVVTYTVIGTSTEGCSASDNIEVEVEANPNVSFFADTLLGCEPFNVFFQNETEGVVTDCVWELNGEQIDACGDLNYTFLNSGLFSVSLYSETVNGCNGYFEYVNYIDVRSNPDADFNANPLATDILDGEISFTNESTGATSYQWDFGDQSGISSVVNPTHQFPTLSAGTYPVTLVATIYPGCSDTVVKAIEVIEDLFYFIPNSFTPDGDEFNQVFQPVFVMGFDPYDFQMVIFNKWGEIIWETLDANAAWDGTYNGKIVPPGTYVWQIEFKSSLNDKRFKESGHLNVIR